MIPLCFYLNYWIFTLILFFVSFLFLIEGYIVFNVVGISSYFGCDVLRYGLIFLSFWICCLILLASSGIYLSSNFIIFFMFTLLILLSFLLFTFMRTRLFIFYLFFESSLIPTFFLILGWGYQPERVQAGIYLLFYTLFASLPLLLSIFNLYYYFDSLNIFLYWVFSMLLFWSFYLLFIIIGFFG